MRALLIVSLAYMAAFVIDEVFHDNSWACRKLHLPISLPRPVRRNLFPPMLSKPITGTNRTPYNFQTPQASFYFVGSSRSDYY